MNYPRRKDILRLTLAGAVLSSWFLVGAVAQDTTTSSTHTGTASVTTEVKSATVVYVSGNDLVVKTDDGTIKHFVVPNSRTVTVDGKQLTVHDLKPGMRLTRTITTTSTPKTVQTVRTIKGKVWYVNPPHGLILSLPDGNKQYKVPDGTMFDIDGKKVSIFHVKKGMLISATVITDVPQTDVSNARDVTGVAPPTPPIEGALLILAPIPPPPPVEEAAAAPAPAPAPELPKTGSLIPLIGFLGLLSLGISLGMRKLRS